jgi:hypothetical protein
MALLQLDQLVQRAFVDIGGRHVFLGEDAGGKFRVAVRACLDRLVLGLGISIAQFLDAVEQRALFRGFQQRFDLLDQGGRAAGRLDAIRLEELRQARVAALDDGGRAPHRGEGLGVPFAQHAFLGQRRGHHRTGRIGDHVHAPDGGHGDHAGQCQHQGKDAAEARPQFHVNKPFHS